MPSNHISDSSPISNNNNDTIKLKNEINGNVVKEEEVRSPVCPLFESFAECPSQVITDIEGMPLLWLCINAVHDSVEIQFKRNEQRTFSTIFSQKW